LSRRENGARSHNQRVWGTIVDPDRELIGAGIRRCGKTALGSRSRKRLASRAPWCERRFRTALHGLIVSRKGSGRYIKSGGNCASPPGAVGFGLSTVSRRSGSAYEFRTNSKRRGAAITPPKIARRKRSPRCAKREADGSGDIAGLVGMSADLEFQMAVARPPKTSLRAVMQSIECRSSSRSISRVASRYTGLSTFESRARPNTS